MNILVDSGFFYALYNTREIENHNKAKYSFEEFVDPKRVSNKLLFLWPVLYKMINTRFVKRNIEESDRLLKILESRNMIVYINDGDYRDECLSDVFNFEDRYRSLSLVDRVIRSVLGDSKLKIDAIFTFNPRDFYDICNQRGLRFLCQEEGLK